MQCIHRYKRRAFSVLELLAVVTIFGIIAAIVVPRITTSGDMANQKTHEHNKATINTTVEQFYMNENKWPADDLSDIGADPHYFPNGVPKNPIDGSIYVLDSTTHRVK